MKHIKYIFIVLLVIALAGCEKEDGTGVELNTKVKMKVENTIDEISLSSNTIEVYSSELKPGTDYVDIEEFIQLLEGGIGAIDVEKGNTMILTHNYEFQESTFFQFIVEIDPVENTISFNDIGFLGIIGLPFDSDYVFEFELIDVEQEEGNNKVKIDFDDYNFDIVEENERYFMPLFLANLFFTGDYINVFENNGKVYVSDDLMEISETLDTTLIDENQEQDMIENSIGYVALLSDYFIGIQNYDNSKTLGNIELLNMTFETFGKEIQTIVNDLDDPHTQLLYFGYGNDKIMYRPIDNKSKTGLFYQTYLANECDEDTVPAYITDAGEVYILRIDEFTEETKDILDEKLVDLDEDKFIVIDLTCNTGGMIGGMFDLLSFMTNESFDIYYSNSLTGTETKESFQPTSNRMLENDFVILIDPVTFSAGSLMAAICMDNNIAPVVGSQTSGGAAAVGITILPNNMILTYSSNIVFTNSSGSNIDNTVRAGLYKEYVDDIPNLINDISQSVLKTFRVEVLEEKSTNKYDLSFDISNSNKDVKMIKYKTEIVDYTTSELILSFTDDEDVFSILYEKEENDVVYVIVYAEFVYGGIVFEEEITRLIIDDLPSEPTKDLTSITLNVKHNAHWHPGDVDTVKFELEEYTEITAYIEEQYWIEYSLYDENFEFISKGNFWKLEPGTYYIQFDENLIDEGTYQYSIDICDGSINNGFYLETNQESYEFYMQSDYKVDRWFYVIVNEKSLVTFNWEFKDLRDEYLRISSNGFSMYRYDRISMVDGDVTLLLDPGVYKMDMDFRDDVTINLNVVPFEKGDVNGSVSFEGDFEQLKDGLVTLTKDAEYDTEIFRIDVNATTKIFIDAPDGTRVTKFLYHEDHGYIDLFGLNGIDLQLGTNYLIIELTKDYESFDMFVKILSDQNTPNNRGDMNFDEPIIVETLSTDDKSYYDFTLTETIVFDINLESYFNSQPFVHIYDQSTGENRYFGTTLIDTITTSLPPGDYTMVVSGKTAMECIITTTISSSTDDFVNSFNLPIETYISFDIDSNSNQVITGSANYFKDDDVFVLNITEAGKYYFNNNAVMIVYIDDDFEMLHQNDSLYLEEGRYIVGVYQNQMMDWSIQPIMEE